MQEKMSRFEILHIDGLSKLCAGRLLHAAQIVEMTGL